MTGIRAQIRGGAFDVDVEERAAQLATLRAARGEDDPLTPAAPPPDGWPTVPPSMPKLSERLEDLATRMNAAGHDVGDPAEMANNARALGLDDDPTVREILTDSGDTGRVDA